jgi:hypothetical protein
MVELGVRVKVRTPPVGPVNGAETATGPAKPLVVAGLPRLVEDIFTLAEPPGLKLTLVELLVRVKPLTLIVRTPETLVVSPVAAWLILPVAIPRFVAAVTLIALVTVAPAARVNAAGLT